MAEQPEAARQPNFEEYHRSIAAEFSTLENRIRHLVEHWATDGAHKETVLRAVLRRHLPENMIVGRGFVVTRNQASTEIDLLVVDANVPTLFKDGDLLIVKPDAVRAIIEVKTACQSETDITEALVKIAKNVALCNLQARLNPWSGLFIYRNDSNQNDEHNRILRCANEAYQDQKCPIKSISWGMNTFVRFWDKDPRDGNGTQRNVWHSYQLDGLARSYFLGNLLLALANRSVAGAEYAWFPMQGGKEAHRRSTITTDKNAAPISVT